MEEGNLINNDNKKNYRKVNDVIKTIISIIPTNKLNLLNELNIYNESLWNKAPEVLKTSYTWVPFLNILNKHNPEFTEEWHYKIQDILINTK